MRFHLTIVTRVRVLIYVVTYSLTHPPPVIFIFRASGLFDYRLVVVGIAQPILNYVFFIQEACAGFNVGWKTVRIAAAADIECAGCGMQQLGKLLNGE